MNQLPPEIIDSILYLVSAALGWLARWLQGKGKIKRQGEIIEEQRRFINNKLNKQ